MALKNYVELSDITHKTIRNLIALTTAQGGNFDDLNALLEETNNYYEDMAEAAGVENPEELIFPIPMISKNLLNYYFTYRYADDNTGQTTNEFSGEDPKVTMSNRAYSKYTDTLKSMNKEYLTGNVDGSQDRGVSFGRMVRS